MTDRFEIRSATGELKDAIRISGVNSIFRNAGCAGFFHSAGHTIIYGLTCIVDLSMCTDSSSTTILKLPYFFRRQIHNSACREASQSLCVVQASGHY